MTDINKILELHALARADGERFSRKRARFESLAAHEGRHFVGIVGPRGVGKTVMLRQLAAEHDHAIYLSLDTLDGLDLFDLVRKLHDHMQFELFLLDEVHFVEDFAGTLKKIRDFLNVRIIFTSSVALAMFQSAHDLSRRVRLRSLFPFSFREYLGFKTGEELATVSMQDIIDGQWPAESFRHSYLFEDYLKGGILPFALEELEPLPILENIVTKILQSDIPRVARVRVDEIDLIRKMLAFIGRSDVDGINYSSVSRNLGITKYKAESYIRLMEKAFVLHQVFPKGTNVLKEPKVLMTVPYRLLFRPYKEALGALREDFLATMLTASGLAFHYLKSTRGSKTPDYLIPHSGGEIVVEVGGKGKGREQFKGIQAEKKVIFSHTDDLDMQGIRRPLFLLGMLT